MRELKFLPYYCFISVMTLFLNTNCAGPKSMDSSNATLNIDPVNNISSVATLPQSQIVSNVEKNNQRILVSENNKSLEKKNESLEGENKELVPTKGKSQKKSFSNYIRVKTVYELAMEANPSMFFPHDEFEETYLLVEFY